jgi:flagellar protein FliO/FliZ
MRTLPAIFPALSAAVFGCLVATPLAFADAASEKTPVNLAPDAPAQATQTGGGSIVRTIVGLAVVLGVIYGLYWVLKQVKASKEESASGAGLESLATLPLGTNRSLHLVRAGGEIVLLGSAEHGVTPIRRYSEAEARALGLIGTLEPAGATLASLDGDGTPPKGFLAILRSKTVVR